MISFDAKETFESLTLIKRGRAGQLESRHAGSLRFEFEDGAVIIMMQISSVHYFLEFFADSNNYPYPKSVSFERGLYECIGSSYLKLLQEDQYASPALKRDRHFIYWDDSFMWNILCQNYTILDGREELDSRFP